MISVMSMPLLSTPLWLSTVGAAVVWILTIVSNPVLLGWFLPVMILHLATLGAMHVTLQEFFLAELRRLQAQHSAYRLQLQTEELKAEQQAIQGNGNLHPQATETPRAS